MKRCLVILLGLMLSTITFAQSGTIRFEVLEKGTGVPVPRAEVISAGEKKYTDRSGIIEFSQPPQGPLEFYRPGFKPLKLQPEQWSQKTALQVFLLPASPTDNEVLVRGVKRPEVSRKSLAIEEAKAVAPRGDPAQVTKLLPGVQSSPFSPEITVRGSEPSDTLYYVDGIEVPFVYHTVGGFSVVPERLLDSIEFSAGGFGAQYGGATGGVVVLGTSPEIPERPLTQAKVNLPFYAGVFHERPLTPEQTISTSIRQSYVDLFVEQLVEGDAVIVPFFYDSHLRWLQTDGSKTTKVIALSSLDGIKAVLPVGGDEDGNIKFNLNTYFGALGVEHSDSLGGGWRYRTTPQVVFTRINTEVIDNFVRIRGPEFRLPLEFSLRLQGREKLYLGLEARHTRATVDVLAPRINDDDPFIDFEDAPVARTSLKATNERYAAWSSIDWRLGNIVVTPGLRGFYSTRLSEAGYDPRVSARWEWSKQVRAKAAVGKYSRLPAPQQTDKEFGNPDLTYEWSIHNIVGWERDWGDRYSLDLQLYQKRWFDVVRGDALDRYNNDGERRSRGAELFLRRNRTAKMFGWVSYTYSVTEEREDAGAKYGPAEVDQTHVVNVVGNYQFTGQWSLGGRVNYHSGDRYTAVDSAVYNADLGKYQPRYDDGGRYQSRLPNYYQIDLYNVYDFLYDFWKLKLRTGVEFLSFDRPSFGVDYNYDYSEEELVEGLPPIPYIEISGEF